MQNQKKIEAKYYTVLQSMRLFSEPIKSSSYVAPCEQALRRKKPSNHEEPKWCRWWLILAILLSCLANGAALNDSPVIKALDGASAVLLMAKRHDGLHSFLFVSLVLYSNPIHFSSSSCFHACHSIDVVCLRSKGSLQEPWVERDSF